MIHLEGISHDYNGVRALDGIDLTLETRNWLGLVGPNGSGKTTLIRVLLGLTIPTVGHVRLEGEIPDREKWLAFKSRVGYMPERIRFYDNLTGAEVLRYFASIRGLSPDVIPPILERVGLAGAKHRRVDVYSKGMHQRLNLAQALLADPDVLILDEPTEGLDPHGVRRFFELLRRTGERKRTVLFSSHRLGELEGQVDRVCILGEGRILALGSPRELMGKLKLPVKIHLLLESASEIDASSLHDLGFLARKEDPNHCTAEVSYGEKSKLIGRLFARGIAPKDIWIEEPDLEEVYFEAY
jgi:Cu-processing system ATP-binding protein